MLKTMMSNNKTKMNNKFSFSMKNADSTRRKESTGPSSSSNKRMFMLSKIRKSVPRRFRRETTSTGQKYSKIDKDRACAVVVVPESEIGVTNTFESEFSSSESPVSTTSTTTTAYTEGGSGADDLNVVDARKRDNNTTTSNDTTAISTTITATDNAETKEDLVENIDEQKMTEPVLFTPEENEDQQENVEDFVESTEEQILFDCSSILLKEEETNTDNNIVSFKEALLAPLIMMALLVALVRVMSSIHQISNI